MKPQRNTPERPGPPEQDILIQDIAWLMEELSELRNLIKEIPFAERPMGQESVLDMLSMIGHASDSFFLPLVRDRKWEGDIARDISMEFESRLKQVRLSEHEPEQLLDRLIAKRSDFLSELERCGSQVFQKKILLKEGEIQVSDLLEMMVRFDRKQLKKIAERVLAMELNRQGP